MSGRNIEHLWHKPLVAFNWVLAGLHEEVVTEASERLDSQMFTGCTPVYWLSVMERKMRKKSTLFVYNPFWPGILFHSYIPQVKISNCHAPRILGHTKKVLQSQICCVKQTPHPGPTNCLYKKSLQPWITANLSSPTQIRLGRIIRDLAVECDPPHSHNCQFKLWYVVGNRPFILKGEIRIHKNEGYIYTCCNQCINNAPY